MSRKRLYVLAINFSDEDIAAMSKAFNGEDYILLVDTATGLDETMAKCFEFRPSIVALNIVDDPVNGLCIIDDICDLFQEKPPFFIVPLLTEETNALKDPYMNRIIEIGAPLPRYGDTQNVQDVIGYAQYVMEYTLGINENGQITLPDEVLKKLDWQVGSPIYMSLEGTRVVMRSFDLDDSEYDVFRLQVDELNRVSLPDEIIYYLRIQETDNIITLTILNGEINVSHEFISYFPENPKKVLVNKLRYDYSDVLEAEPKSLIGGFIDQIEQGNFTHSEIKAMQDTPNLMTVLSLMYRAESVSQNFHKHVINKFLKSTNAQINT